MIISVTNAFVTGAPFFEFAQTNCRKDCLLRQVVEHATNQNINTLIEAGLATTGANRK